jgi:hypothetical protein
MQCFASLLLRHEGGFCCCFTSVVLEPGNVLNALGEDWYEPVIRILVYLCGDLVDSVGFGEPSEVHHVQSHGGVG